MTAGSLFTAWGSGVVFTSTTLGSVGIKLPVTMRAAPTLNYSTIRGFDGSNAQAVTSIVASFASADVWSADLGSSGGGYTVGRAVMVQANNSTSAYIDASAEL
jgi:hypothetical protein